MKPIIFSTPMVQAILENRKMQTRRVIKLPEQYVGRPIGEAGNDKNPLGLMYVGGIKRPPYNIGDILWVRETWYLETFYGAHSYVYRASEPNYPVNVGAGQHGWRPSIFMPKDAARIFLRVKDVWVERLQDISLKDAIAEGFSNIDEFLCFWDKLNKKRGYGWEANPWVWVIEFEKTEKEQAKLERTAITTGDIHLGAGLLSEE